MATKERSAKGERCAAAKLKEIDVKKIRALNWFADYTQVELAKMFRISQGAVSLICRQATWKHI